MQNLVFILSVAVSLSILSGCGDSEPFIDPGPDPEIPIDSIVGNWQMTKIYKDGVDLTDECTTKSDMKISKFNSFTGNDFDADQNDCLLTLFSGEWVPKAGNLYTFTIYGHDFEMELDGDTIRTEFTHAFDGQDYIEEHVRQQ